MLHWPVSTVAKNLPGGFPGNHRPVSRDVTYRYRSYLYLPYLYLPYLYLLGEVEIASDAPATPAATAADRLPPVKVVRR